MSNRVLLKLGNGNLQNGFQQVSLVLEKNGSVISQEQGSLPGNVELHDLYNRWKFGYEAYYETSLSTLRGHGAEIEIEDTGIEGFSTSTFPETCAEFQQRMVEWLESASFSKIGNQMRLRFQENDEIAIVIETADEFIQRLPWHFWSLLQDFRKAEIAFSLQTYQRQIVSVKRSKPRILAVFGDSTDLDLEADRRFIRQLKAEPVFLEQPTPDELSQKLDDPQGWDILFFAGHSSEDEHGSIQINATESLTLRELSYALESAIDHGLQLAIFNSCSGLSLGADLAALNMPTVIVMREAIPNRIAQKFLREFLKSFAQGKSLLTAVRHARQQLQVLERNYPCATWLPVVLWNPIVALPTWSSLQHRSTERIWRVAAMVALLTTVGVWGIREQGYLESIELPAYDLALNSRWKTEAPDPRLLVVGVTEADFTKLKQNNPLADETLAQVIQSLRRYQPKAIGLDIYRDRPNGKEPTGKGHAELLAVLQSKEVVSVCKMPGMNQADFPLVAAPSSVGSRNVGFTNFSVDQDKVLRRQVLGMSVIDRGCDTDHALSMRLVLQYLGLAEVEEQENGHVLIGKQELPTLIGAVGGYRSSEAQANLQGYQVMLNYRQNSTVAKQVSLDDVLSNRVSESDIRGKIVLIGYVAASSEDLTRTAYRVGGDEMVGVMIHAHMVSNILSHLLDGRSLITVWPSLAEQGWILLWCSIGGVIGGRLWGYRFWVVGGVAMVSLVVVYICCFNIWAVWIPLMPTELGLVTTGVGVMGWRWFRYNQS
jgi:CHASE2 domain-containing sensor protein